MIDVDKESRERIMTDLNTNFFVEAGAGSGKTTVLVERMVAMVEAGIDISNICAITFTKAAAGEFYARFQRRLSQMNTENARAALKNIDLCFMGTIDSFCNMLLSEHPTAAHIPSNASVISDEELNALCLSMYSRIQKGDIGEETDGLQEKCEWFRSYFWKPSEVFLAGMKELLQTKHVDYHFEVPSEQNCDNIFGKEKEEILRVLKYLLLHPEIVVAGKPQAAQSAWDTLNSNIHILEGAWNENLSDVISTLKRITGLRLIAEYKDHVGALGAEFEKFFIAHTKGTKQTIAHYEVNETADPFLYQRLNSFRYGAAMSFLVPAARFISNSLREKGKLTYADYLLYLRDLLKEDASKSGRLINHITQRHRYFLVDEFQDTNPIQAEILFYLAGCEPKENWRECIPRPGSLFIVGDPKQSIYRFNNADVGAFLRVKELFKGDVGEVLYLSRNYRSCESMCRWFNRVFSELMPENTPNQCKFDRIPVDDKPEYKASFSGVYGYSVPASRSIASSKDPESVAEIIERIIADPNITIQDCNKDSTPRRPEYKDIMVITRRKTNLSYYMNALQNHQIPFQVEGANLFQDCPALIALTYLMAGVADPFDKRAVFCIEKLSGCAVTCEELIQYAKRAKSLSAAGLFTMLLEEQKVFARVSSRNAECVFFALELLRNTEITGEITSIKDAAIYLDKLVNGKSNQERSLYFDLDSNCVHLANLHKVKGLEAPIVIFAEPMCKGSLPDKRIDYQSDPPQGWLFSIDSAITYDYPTEKDLERAALEQEIIRLLYVASTRASNALIISKLETKSKPNKLDFWKQLNPYVDEDILERLAPCTKTPHSKEILDAEVLYREAEDTSVLKDKVSECKSYTIKRPSTIKIKRVTDAKDDPQEHRDVESSKETQKPLAKRNAALIGTMVHRLMECLVISNNNVKLEPLIADIVKEYDADDTYYREILRNVGETMRSGGYPQNNGVAQDLLTELMAADEVYCEIPFSFQECQGENACIWDGVMDVVYRKDGRWHILDYKTNADPSDLDEQYTQQLSAYIHAFQNIMEEDADALIYHIEV